MYVWIDDRLHSLATLFRRKRLSTTDIFLHGLFLKTSRTTSENWESLMQKVPISPLQWECIFLRIIYFSRSVKRFYGLSLRSILYSKHCTLKTSPSRIDNTKKNEPYNIPNNSLLVAFWYIDGTPTRFFLFAYRRYVWRWDFVFFPKEHAFCISARIISIINIRNSWQYDQILCSWIKAVIAEI